MKLMHVLSSRSSIPLYNLAHQLVTPWRNFCLSWISISLCLGCCRRGTIPFASSDTWVAPASPGWLQGVQAPCTAVENSVTKLTTPRFGSVPAGQLDNGKLQK